MNLSTSVRPLAIAAAALVATASLAGPRYQPPGVSIRLNADGSGYAAGTLGGTRNSENNVERLLCSVTRSENRPTTGAIQRSTFVNCIARDSSGATASCTSENDVIGSGLIGLSNDGFIQFNFDFRGNCTDILVYQSASLERKQ